MKRLSVRSLLVLILSFGLGAPPPAGAQLPFGPLTTVEGGPLQRVGFSHAVEGADLLGAGGVQVEAWIGYSNIFEEDSTATHRLFMDLERLSTDVGLRWGMANRLEVGARLSFETTGAGVLDGFVSAWHRALGLPTGNRKRYPIGVYAQRLTDSTGAMRLDVPSRTMALEDVRLFAKLRAWDSSDGRRLLSLSGTARFPMQDNGVGPRRADVSLMALARASWTPWYVHAAMGGATQRSALDYDGLLRPGAFFADVALERLLGSRMSGVVQLSLESPRLQGFDDPEIDGWPINVALGVTSRIGDDWRMDVSFQEDVATMSPAADFTLAVGVRRSW